MEEKKSIRSHLENPLDFEKTSDPCLMATNNSGIRVTMPIGTNCPLKCKHCYQEGEVKHEVNLETSLLAINRMAEAGVTKLYWDGAEPMTNKDIPKYLKLINELKSSEKYNKDIFNIVSIGTSGMYVNRKRAQDLFDSGLRNIMISLDGAIKETNDEFRGEGVFEKAMDAIDILVNIGYELRVGSTLWAGMVDQIPKLVQLAYEKGAKEVSFNWLQPLGNALKYPEILIPNSYFRDIAKKVNKVENEYSGRILVNMHRRNPIDKTKICKGGRQIVYIAGDRVSPCSWINVLAPEFQSQMSLKEFSLTDILENDPNIKKFRKLVNNISENGALCPAICKIHNEVYEGPDPNDKFGVHNFSIFDLR
ncbi:MAG: radical SAM protein [Nanoarchaeota archaeon]|nr:radical SAM protein [Nanoarchaeota archaeon]